MMRKMHYNEGMNIKLARQLIANEDDEDEDEDEDEEMRDVTEEPREEVATAAAPAAEVEEKAEETEDIHVDPPQEGEDKLWPSGTLQLLCSRASFVHLHSVTL